MYQLNDEQISLLRKEVEKQDIHLRHLATDLLDHICCEVEELIWQGLKFQDALARVQQIIGTDGLQQIQKDTLYLTDKNYRSMKNSMKIAGVAGMALLAFGAMFKIQHYPGATPLLIIGFFLLGGIFFPIAILTIRKESSELEKPLAYGAALIGGLATIFGTLCKVIHWPGAMMLFIIGYGLLGFVLLPTLLMSILKQTSDRFLRRTYIIGALSLFFCIVGSLAKINHYPGALPFLVAGSLGVSVIFLPLYTIRLSPASTNVQAKYIFMLVGVLFFNLFNLLLAIH